ncbi:MAG: GIY-YIG nuclease family protein [bacterium]
MFLFTVNILYSDSFNQSYVVQTRDLEARIHRHNDGSVKSTKHYLPWRLIYQEQHATSSEAIKREQWFKSGVGREMIKQLIGKS